MTTSMIFLPEASPANNIDGAAPSTELSRLTALLFDTSKGDALSNLATSELAAVVTSGNEGFYPITMRSGADSVTSVWLGV